MATIIIANDFTGNTTRIRATVGSVISPAQARRIRQRLVASDCMSGGPLGERGPQTFAYRQIDAEGSLRIVAAA